MIHRERARRHRPAWLLWGLLAACGAPQINAGQSLTVVDVSPHDGATEVAIDWAEAVCFSQPVHAQDATADHFWVTDDASGKSVGGLAISLSGDDPHCVALGHAPLQPGIAYRIHAGKGVRAAQGDGALPIDVESRFRTSFASTFAADGGS